MASGSSGPKGRFSAGTGHRALISQDGRRAEASQSALRLGAGSLIVRANRAALWKHSGKFIMPRPMYL